MLDILVAIVISALSGLGVGGGGLFALYLKFFSDYTQLELQAVNLIFFFFACFSALLLHLMHRRIYPLAVALMIGTGVVGCIIGSAVAIKIGGDMLSKLFGAMMVGAGIYSLFKRDRPKI